ncbi:MAG: protein-L-isoaspartate(D-aspartate) O-methyltransferase [Acidobacteriota bacterium]
MVSRQFPRLVAGCLLALGLVLGGCGERAAISTNADPSGAITPAMNEPVTTPPAPRSALEARRAAMVEEQIQRRGIEAPAVLAALRQVPRHLFVPDPLQEHAYEDRPLPIGHEQTISQPYIVALMTDLLQLDGDQRVLEIGTGSGYHAAVLSRVAGEVYSIEIVEALGREAAPRLQSLGYSNIRVRVGDGYDGWPEAAPFDAIVLTAAPATIPQPLVDQLRVGGRLVAPVGENRQDLRLMLKTPSGLETRDVIPVRFVPMTGKARNDEATQNEASNEAARDEAARDEAANSEEAHLSPTPARFANAEDENS